MNGEKHHMGTMHNAFVFFPLNHYIHLVCSDQRLGKARLLHRLALVRQICHRNACCNWLELVVRCFQQPEEFSSVTMRFMLRPFDWREHARIVVGFSPRLPFQHSPHETWAHFLQPFSFSSSPSSTLSQCVSLLLLRVRSGRSPPTSSTFTPQLSSFPMLSEYCGGFSLFLLDEGPALTLPLVLICLQKVFSLLLVLFKLYFFVLAFQVPPGYLPISF